MRSSQLDRVRNGIRRLALASLSLAALLVVGSDVGAQESREPDLPEAGREFRLEYREGVTQGAGDLSRRDGQCRVMWDSGTSPRPELDGREVLSGVLRIGENQAVQLAWDKDEDVLYADRNRSGDLSDDEPVEDPTLGEYGSRSFSLFLSDPEEARGGRWRVRLTVYPGWRQNWLAGAWIDSGWEGEIELDGRHYRLTVIDDADGIFAGGEDLLRLRWDEIGAVPPDLIRLPERIGIGGRLYDLALRLEEGGGGGVIATFTERMVSTVSCEFTGTHLAYVVLEQRESDTPRTRIFLEKPAGEVLLPEGLYRVNQMTLEMAPEQGALSVRGQWLTIEGEENTFRSGGPLRNHLEIRRSSPRTLEIWYQLLGADGEEYGLRRLRGQEAPSLSIYSGERKIASGRFRYG